MKGLEMKESTRGTEGNERKGRYERPVGFKPSCLQETDSWPIVFCGHEALR
jgi:hypothetical protein